MKDARSTSRSTIQPLPGREGSHTMQRKNPKQFAKSRSQNAHVVTFKTPRCGINYPRYS